MNKLIPLSEYVLQLNEERTNDKLSVFDFAEKVIAYTKFLRQPLTLSMFVPCFDDGHAFDLPLIKFFDKEFDEEQERLLEKAKEKVLFEGFEVGYYGASIISVDPVSEELPRLSFDKNDGDCRPYKTVEDLVSYGLPLTSSALNLIGVNE